MDPDYDKFSEFLAQMNKGQIDENLTDLLAEVARAVGRHNKKGAITLKINLEPGKDSEGVFHVGADMPKRLPRSRGD